MASNFRIFIHRNNDKLHLRLVGEFDGTSAFELINTLNANNGKVGKIIIDTCRLTSINPFGLGVFQKNCPIYNLSSGLTFTGKYGNTLAPQRHDSL
jgi:anti-anti-sigma regulatory factor